MRKDRDNPLALSSKKPGQSQSDFGRALERLRAELEAEKSRTQWAGGLLCVEFRHLLEKAEREERRAVRELTAQRGCQRNRITNRHQRLSAKEVNLTDGRQYTEEAFCLQRGETSSKLEQLLLTLYEKINGEQPSYKLHHRQDCELEKAVVLCHLLDAHGRLLQRRKRAGPSREAAHADSSRSSQTNPLLTCSRAPSVTSSPQKKSKQDERRQPVGRGLSAADPCTTAAVVSTCRSSSLRIHHPPNTPNAGWDIQPPCCSKSSGSHGSPPSKGMDRNMEVSYVILYIPQITAELNHTAHVSSYSRNRNELAAICGLSLGSY